MSRYDASERLTPPEEAQAAKGTLDTHWRRSYRIGCRSANWASYRGLPGFAQCRDCGYFWSGENLEVKPNASGYLAQCLNCWIREHQPAQVAYMRQGPPRVTRGRGNRR